LREISELDRTRAMLLLMAAREDKTFMIVVQHKTTGKEGIMLCMSENSSEFVPLALFLNEEELGEWEPHPVLSMTTKELEN
jgi:hypothetical protein